MDPTGVLRVDVAAFEQFAFEQHRTLDHQSVETSQEVDHVHHNPEQEQEPSAQAEASPAYLRHLNPMRFGNTPLPREALEQDFSVIVAWRLLR